MMEPNSYNIGDAIEFVKSLKGSGISVITSPPYNKNLKGRLTNPSPSERWKSSKLMLGAYESYGDNMKEEDYVAWQREFLTACMDCIGDDGIIMYNIGRRIHKKREDDRQSIVNGFPLRQKLIWFRGSSLNLGGKRPTLFPPSYELIYLISRDNWKLPQKYIGEMLKWKDVWTINPETGKNPHPAPFPLELATRMVKCASDSPAVCDPFAGSGTTGIAAMELGIPYYLNDLSEEYRQMFYDRKQQYESPSDNLFE